MLLIDYLKKTILRQVTIRHYKIIMNTTRINLARQDSLPSSQARSPTPKRINQLQSSMQHAVFDGFRMQQASPYSQLNQILSKSHHLRTHSEQRYLLQFIKTSMHFSTLIEVNGIQFCRGIMRKATIMQAQEGQIIARKNSNIEKIFLVLEGSLGTIANLDETDMLANPLPHQTYQALTTFADKQIKRKLKLQKHGHKPEETQQQIISIEGLNFLDQFQPGQIFGDQQRCRKREFMHTTVAKQFTLLLVFQLHQYFVWLQHLFEAKLVQSQKILSSHPCFSGLPRQTLDEIVRAMKVHRIQKNGFVFKQNQQANSLFLLVQGQLNIQKEANLFVDNPNQLYTDRRSLTNRKDGSKEDLLPYADFQQLYNYQPKTKIFQLGVLPAPCIFGQQQLIQDHPRQASIRCTSLSGVYLSLQLKRLLQILDQQANMFVFKLKEMLKNRLLYRQNIYSFSINFNNKNNLDYFYTDNNSTPKRKSIVNKINKKILQNQQQQQRTSQQVQKLQQLLSSPQEKSRGSLQQSRKVKGDFSPSFNFFNFHRMLKTKILKLSPIDSSPSERKNNPPISKQQREKQMKIVNNSHTWNMVRDAVREQNKQSRKLGSYKHKINFSNPLIEESFSDRINQQMRRLDREKKAGKVQTIKTWRSRSTSNHQQ